MNETAQNYFNEIKKTWCILFYGLSMYFFMLPLTILASTVSPWITALMYLSLLPIILYMVYIGAVYCNYSKRKEYYPLKKQHPENDDDEINQLEEYFSNPDLQWKFYFPWKFYPVFVKSVFIECLYGKMVPGNIHFFKLDLLRKILFKFYKKEEQKQNFDFILLPSVIQSRFMELQTPYMKCKFAYALFKNLPKTLIVDNVELHFGEYPAFYSKWFYLRYLDNRICSNNLIIDMPWHNIKDIFKYFSTPYSYKFALTFTSKIDNNKNYANFLLPKLIPINSFILSSMSPNSLTSTLKNYNIFSIKKLEIIESRLSEDDLKFLKTFKLQNLLLNLSFCESYESIDSILEAVSGIPNLHIDITFSFYLNGYFEECAVKWVKKYGYPKNFTFIIKIFNEFHIKFL